ncbi:hypothetical protein FPQ18DRAFT_73966 [Pyronema domesticum]|nr:hypothetical protein FPQ18DRAFT_73966 [Pyronema domesticum]
MPFNFMAQQRKSNIFKLYNVMLIYGTTGLLAIISEKADILRKYAVNRAEGVQNCCNAIGRQIQYLDPTGKGVALHHGRLTRDTSHRVAEDDLHATANISSRLSARAKILFGANFPSVDSKHNQPHQNPARPTQDLSISAFEKDMFVKLLLSRCDNIGDCKPANLHPI